MTDQKSLTGTVLRTLRFQRQQLIWKRDFCVCVCVCECVCVGGRRDVLKHHGIFLYCFCVFESHRFQVYFKTLRNGLDIKELARKDLKNKKKKNRTRASSSDVYQAEVFTRLQFCEFKNYNSLKLNFISDTVRTVNSIPIQGDPSTKSTAAIGKKEPPLLKIDQQLYNYFNIIQCPATKFHSLNGYVTDTRFQGGTNEYSG